jgi:hypothetical protein
MTPNQARIFPSSSKIPAPRIPNLHSSFHLFQTFQQGVSHLPKLPVLKTILWWETQNKAPMTQVAAVG